MATRWTTIRASPTACKVQGVLQTRQCLIKYQVKFGAVPFHTTGMYCTHYTIAYGRSCFFCRQDEDFVSHQLFSLAMRDTFCAGLLPSLNGTVCTVPLTTSKSRGKKRMFRLHPTFDEGRSSWAQHMQPAKATSTRFCLVSNQGELVAISFLEKQTNRWNRREQTHTKKNPVPVRSTTLDVNMSTVWSL